ncbi:branched-chain amino acid ABC transporter permease [Sedimentibacter sp.]|uniref:branched-chain amino acid ABC transporter permease n=1 Tax=Sedimentibacter sp. TaxID=1960295 RepID=UPI00289A4FB7|nr:branched-chain amino acid ABC transporter permease [Sedimentibacter sp.]
MYIASVVVTTCTNIVAVIGLALLTGYTGMFSLGHAGFMCIGAYAAVLLNKYFMIPYVFAIILGGLASVLISIVIGYPTLRNKLRGDYFAICMLGFGTVVRLILNNMNNPITNGALGITNIPKLTTLWSALLFMIVLVYFMWNFVNSQYGKNCVAIQQQEVAAEMMGVSVVRTKLLSLAISAFYCGVAGGMLGFWLQYIAPATFSDTRSNDFLATLVTGGTNSITGPLIAAALMTTSLEYLRFLVNWRLVVYGLLYILIMRFRPEGIMGYREFSLKSTIRFFKEFPQNRAKLTERWLQSFSKLTKKANTKEEKKS